MSGHRSLASASWCPHENSPFYACFKNRRTVLGRRQRSLRGRVAVGHTKSKGWVKVILICGCCASRCQIHIFLNESHLSRGWPYLPHRPLLLHWLAWKVDLVWSSRHHPAFKNAIAHIVRYVWGRFLEVDIDGHRRPTRWTQWLKHSHINITRTTKLIK